MAFMQTGYFVAETKYGKVRLHAVNGSRVMVDVGDETGHAHINDNRPALTFRDQEYIGSVFFNVTADSLTVADDVTASSLSKRPQWSPAPRTHAAAMVDAMRETVSAYIADHPEFLAAAEFAQINNDLDAATEVRDKLRAELAIADQTVAALAARFNAYEPPQACGYCGGLARYDADSLRWVHADSADRVSASSGDFVSARHNVAGSQILTVDLVDLIDSE